MRGKNTSVKWKMVGMILLYWAIPFVLLLALGGISWQTGRKKQDWSVSGSAASDGQSEQYRTD